MKNSNLVKSIGVIIFLLFWAIVLYVLADYGVIGDVNCVDRRITCSEGVSFSEISSGHPFILDFNANDEFRELLREGVMNSEAEWILKGEEAVTKLLLDKTISNKITPEMRNSVKGKLAPKLVINSKLTIAPEPNLIAFGYNAEVKLEGDIEAVFIDIKSSRHFLISCNIESSGLLSSRALRIKACKLLSIRLCTAIEYMLKDEGTIEIKE